ncbi:MAG: CocE/NonD family hydrolase [Myxococcales bacterium]|nr:CocE/NonD family hydrolase [Myxococcales bacterium]
MWRAALGLVLVSTLWGCGHDERFAPNELGSTGPASFEVRGTLEQVYVTHADPGANLQLVDGAGSEVATGTADELGSLVFRSVAPAKGYRVRSGDETSAAVDVFDGSAPPPSDDFYASQKLVSGSGYLTTRDGTKLAIYVTLPGPAEDGPYPTVVNYSGYDPAKPGEPLGDYEALCGSVPVLCDAPSDPSALIAAVMGYATVGVNMRGTGCSGGAYDFFEPLQLTDGYDVIETVAAQDWVLGHRVGMTGLSYPGISQLFVAKTHPPSLAAITPLSVIGNTVTTLVPGGILNDGFAISWIDHVLDKARPYGQGWEQARVDAGDEICEDNQLLHGQRVDVIQKAYDNPYYTDEVAGPLNPTTFVGEIDVPVFLAGAWQDEQTGPFFFTLLDQFAKSPLARFTVYNGVHPDAFGPQTLIEWKYFLDLYVAKRVPRVEGFARVLAPQLFNEIFKVELSFPEERFQEFKSHAAALAAYEKEPRLRVLLEAGSSEPLGAPQTGWHATFPAWPVPTAQPRRFYFQPDGTLAGAAPSVGSAASRFALDPAAGQRGILAKGGNVWDPLPAYAWKPLETGQAVAFTTAVLDEDLVVIGTGSVDLWLRASVNDADLEVNLSEVRPDGQEMYVQSGWLRASHRALDAKATELWPEHTYRETDEKMLVPGSWEPVRVGIAGMSHAFRKGSRIRVSVDTPGDSRADWRFNLKKFTTDAFYDVGHSSAQPSSVVLSVVPGLSVPTPLPPCPSLRGQQCRVSVEHDNQPSP